MITFAYNQHPEYPFIMVANRDEFYARPTLNMDYWKDHNDILAGIDLEQHGTWLGINKAGKFTAVTNFREGGNKDTGLKSRGHLTRHFLTQEISAEAYLEELQTSGSQFGGYNLLLGDDSGLYYGSNKGAESRRLQPGVYALSNAHLDTRWPKVLQAKQHLQALLRSGLSIDTLARVLSSTQAAEDRDLPDTGISYEREKQLSSCFINIEGYGTRATTVLLQDTEGVIQLVEFRFDQSGKSGQQHFTLTTPLIG
nr:NRDE family protein [Neptunomonas qingdaonensis]